VDELTPPDHPFDSSSAMEEWQLTWDLVKRQGLPLNALADGRAEAEHHDERHDVAKRFE